ncbi:MAG TPA: hypothetical protein VFY82_14055 [Acidimicrobiales bacterium]|nr:hypothetical protein [Acidimicrobiales bacterium]
MSSPETTPTASGARRIKPPAVAMAIGIGFAIVVVVSGIAATALQWHDDSAVQREVFINIPSAWKAIFYTVLPILIVVGAIAFANRIKNWQRGGPDARATT